jgi:hypothetical protein
MVVPHHRQAAMDSAAFREIPAIGAARRVGETRFVKGTERLRLDPGLALLRKGRGLVHRPAINRARRIVTRRSADRQSTIGEFPFTSDPNRKGNVW